MNIALVVIGAILFFAGIGLAIAIQTVNPYKRGRSYEEICNANERLDTLMLIAVGLLVCGGIVFGAGLGNVL